MHRLHKHEHADTPEKQLFNERSDRFLRILHALRNASLTHEDYFWLCRLKRCHASASRRAFFADAPVLMEFRRTTEANEEDNCEYYNRQRLRVMAKTRGVPVIAFDAVHDGKPQQDAMEIADASFSGLQRRLELAEGARIILTHNLSVEHGLINGSQARTQTMRTSIRACPLSWSPNSNLTMDRSSLLTLARGTGCHCCHALAV